MKKVKLTSFGTLAVLAVLASCDDGMDFGNQTGTISPEVAYDATVVGAARSRSAAEFSDLTVEDLMLTITNAAGDTEEFSYGAFPVDRGFAVGKYTMTAYYGDINEEGFEKPAVYGETEFSVTEGKTTQVALTAKPSKSMVSIEFDEAALNYFTDIKATINSAGGHSLDYATDETRFIYLKPGELSVDVTFTKPNGKGGTLEVAKFTAEAQHRYTLGIKLGGDGTGEVNSLTVTYDETLTQEEVTVDISDEVLMIPAPTVTISGITEGEVLSFIKGSPLSEPLRIDINAQGGIKSAVLTTTGSDINLPEGWPAEIDLATASAQQQELLKGFGFKNIGIFNNPGKLAAFDLTSVVEGFPATPNGATPVTFGIKVIDKRGMVAEPLTFQVKVDNLVIELQSIDGYAYAGEETADVLVSYNGTLDLKQALTINYLASSGKMLPTEIISVEPYSRASQLYKVSVKIPSDAQLPITLQAKAGDITTGEVQIPLASAPVITYNENDVFSTSAWFKVSSDEYDVAGNTISIEVKEGSGSYSKATGTQVGDEFHITGGLKPGTTYTVRAKIGALASEPITMTTEAATQIPGGDMESWSAEKTLTKTATTWHYNDPVEPWFGSNATSYSKASATTFRSATSAVGMSSDAHGGAYSAYVRTTGSGSTSLQKNANNGVFAGELTLGNANEGMALGSRPSSISFWYKYTPFTDGDKGLAEITLLDGNNNELGSFTSDLAPAASFTKVTKTFTYPRNCAKAKTIKVRFRSTATENYLAKGNVNTINDTHMLSAGSESEAFIGSVLLVDDVELVY